jgi:hypothetical protein
VATKINGTSVDYMGTTANKANLGNVKSQRGQEGKPLGNQSTSDTGSKISNNNTNNYSANSGDTDKGGYKPARGNNNSRGTSTKRKGNFPSKKV